MMLLSWLEEIVAGWLAGFSGKASASLGVGRVWASRADQSSQSIAQGCLASNLSYGTEVKVLVLGLFCDTRATVSTTLGANDSIYSSISLLDAVSECKNKLLCGSEDMCNTSLSEFEIESAERVFRSELPLKTTRGHDLLFSRLEDAEDSQSNGLESRSLIRMTAGRVGCCVRWVLQLCQESMAVWMEFLWSNPLYGSQVFTARTRAVRVRQYL